MSGTYQDPYAPLFDPDGADFPAVYPNTQASGVNNVSGFTAFELWAGEADIITSQGTAGANIAQFQVLTVDANGHWIPWTGFGGAVATQGIVFGANAGVAAGDTITINGNVITYVITEATENQININSLTRDQVLYNTCALINSSQDTYGVTAAYTAGSPVLVLSALEPGTAGNAITVAATGNPSPNASTLAGGTAETSSAKAYAFAAQAAVSGGPVPVYVGGAPNHEALGWPAGVTSLDERKMAFLGTNIIISKLL